MFEGGYWVLARCRGAPIRLHWSIPVVALVFGGFNWNPGFLFGYACVVLVHELGHAALVRRVGRRIISVEVTGFGGTCSWSGNASPFEAALIAWGGVLAQLILFAGAELWLSSLAPTSRFGSQLVSTFTHTNLQLLALNLLPIPPLDGARAWRIFRAFRARDSGNSPHGTWRDPSADASRQWFDHLLRRTRLRARASSEFEGDPEGPLSSETQQALDRLLKSVTGRARDSERGGN